MSKEFIYRDIELEEIVTRLNYGGFFYARFSDGGFFCMQGREGRNCDGVMYTKDQSVALQNAIRNKEITHGITSIALHVANAKEWLLENGFEDVEWVNADVINKASESGNLWPFVYTLRNKNVILVGPNHLTRLQAFPILKFIQTHPYKAFEQSGYLYNLIVSQLLCIEESELSETVVIISAGQGAAPTLVDWLSPFSRIGLSVLDIGSIWDPYVGVLSRSGHKRMGKKKILELGWDNFKKDISSWWPKNG